MNKKTIFLGLLVLLLANCINVAGIPGPGGGKITSLVLSWESPEEIIYDMIPGETLNIEVNVTCINGPCLNTTANLQYCSGEDCIDYQNIQTETGELRLTEGSSLINLGTVEDSETARWAVEWPEATGGSIYKLKVTGTAKAVTTVTLTGRQLEMESFITIVSIVSPKDTQEFYIGSQIDFNSNIFTSSEEYSIEWDSNKDTNWKRYDKNISYNGLSIGDHNISLTLTDSVDTKTRVSVIIHIKPITTDVLSVSDFEIIKIDPENRFSVNGKIKVKARVNYYLTQAIDAKAFIIISNPITNTAIYGPSPFYLSLAEPTYEEYDLNIDLSSYSFEERENYKVEFIVVSNFVESSPEYFIDPMDSESAYWDDGEDYYIPQQQIPEQNKANNSDYQIIELGPATLGDLTQAPEINPTAIILILFAVLIILRKK